MGRLKKDGRTDMASSTYWGTSESIWLTPSTKAYSERQRGDEIGEARQLIESRDGLLYASNGARAEHHTGQLSKLLPNFVFSIGLLKITACAFTQSCDLPPIREGDGHPCWLEPGHVFVERRVLANSHSPADGRDRG